MSDYEAVLRERMGDDVFDELFPPRKHDDLPPLSAKPTRNEWAALAKFRLARYAVAVRKKFHEMGFKRTYIAYGVSYARTSDPRLEFGVAADDYFFRSEGFRTVDEVVENAAQAAAAYLKREGRKAVAAATDGQPEGPAG